MSNEKPVRITVGDVKEVVEATTIQADTVIAKPASSVSYTASVPDRSGYSLVYLAGIVGFILLMIAGFFGVMNSPAPVAAVPITNTPAVSTPTPPDSNNAPIAKTSQEAPVNAGDSSMNAPVDTNTDSKNTPVK